MSKQKAHKGVSKTLKVRKSGTVTKNKVGKLHNTGSKSGSFNRDKRKSSTLSSGDRKRLKNLIN